MINKKLIRSIYDIVPSYYKEGHTYRKYYNLAQRNDYLTREEFDRVQLRHLTGILRYASIHVPYYSRLFKDIRFHIDKVDSLNCMKDIPITCKEQVQENLRDFQSKIYPSSRIRAIYSGGSTGIPAEYLSQKSDSAIERAFMHFQWSRVGFSPHNNNKLAMIRGVKPLKGDYEIRNGILVFSSYIKNQKMYGEYLERLIEFDPDFIHAYPSIIDLWAQYIIDNNLNVSLSKLKAILCGSENLDRIQRERIEKAFHTRVYSWYGHSERGCLAGECEVSNDYHILPDYGYAESITSSGDIAKSDEPGNLIVTSFNNKVMPLIRFNTCDEVILSDQLCPCGRGARLIKKVVGRTNQYLIDSKGKIIPANVLLPYELLGLFKNVRQYQFVQEKVGECIFLMNVKPSFSVEDEKKIKAEIERELGRNMRFLIKYVDTIPRTKNGKLMFLDVSRRLDNSTRFN